MPFLSLKTVNFRNLSNDFIDLSSSEVFFVGKNGQGKSNLLEALYYCSYGSSFRTHLDSEIIKSGESEMSINCLYKNENDITSTTSIYVKKDSKKIEKNGKYLKDRKDLVNTMPCVLYNHDDLDFVVGAPERRRFFIDQSLTMYDVLYLDVLRKYKRILKSRNISLKENKTDLLLTYDIQLVMNGLEIQKKRKNAIFNFNQIFSKLYEDISGISDVKIKYVPSWRKKENSENINTNDFYDKNIPEVDEVLENLKKSRQSELIMGTTLSGPHRDKIYFTRNNEVFVPKSSTGQRRLLALVLRTAQAEFYSKITNYKPILLMDDVLLELDPEKRKKFNYLLPDYEQLICTFLPGEPYESYMKNNTFVYEINNGVWNKI